MLGNLENPGVMFLTMMELYRRIDELKDDKICEVAVSYCEVGVREREREGEHIFSPYKVFLEASLALRITYLGKTII